MTIGPSLLRTRHALARLPATLFLLATCSLADAQQAIAVGASSFAPLAFIDEQMQAKGLLIGVPAWALWALTGLVVVVALLFGISLFLRKQVVRKAANLRKSEERYRTLVEWTPEAIAVHRDGVLLYVNPAAIRMFGARSAQDLIGKPILDLIHPDYHQSWMARLRNLVDNGVEAPMMERRLLKLDGTAMDAEVQGTLIDFDGSPAIHLAIRDVSERKQAEATLAAKTELLRDTFNNMSEGISVVDRNLCLVGWNRRFVELLGFPESLLHENTTFADLIRFNALRGEYGPGDPEEHVRSRVELATHFRSHRIERTRPNGTILEIGGSALPGGGFVTTYTDITERRKSEAAVRNAAQRLEIALEGSQISVWETDLRTGTVWLDPAWAKYLGHPAAETRTTSTELADLVHPEDRPAIAAAAVRAMKGEVAGYAIDHRVKSANGEWRWIHSRGRVTERDAAGRALRMSGTNTDITARKMADERINDLAFFDQLTGLPNRTLLLDRLKQVIVGSSRTHSYSALLFIDLDNFKTLNDILGHDTGDLLLKQAAQRLKLCVREVDTVARFGGDEFVVVLAGLGTDEADAATGTELVAEKILASLSQAYPLGGFTHHSTASLGVTLFRGGAATLDDLMKQADLAMYKSKEAGRNAWRFFDPHMESAVKERAVLEGELRRAIEEKQFVLHYQAQIGRDRQVTGAEVLIRWQHVHRGMILPAEFIPLAEETGMILRLGHWVLETACTQLARWAVQPDMARLTVAVNVSAHQFRQAGFVDEVLAVLRKTGANPERLKLELTESMLVHNVEDIIDKMFALKSMGVGFSLDDFGTGYSSLSYLKRLPLDSLKIDQSFVRDVLTDPNDAAIARTVVALTQNLGLGVIAEGVETEGQRDFLASSGCHAYQGHYFSRPLPVDGFEEFARLLP